MTPRTDRNRSEVKSRAGSTLPHSEPKIKGSKGNLTARSSVADRGAPSTGTSELSSIRDESDVRKEESEMKIPEVIDLPFFKQDAYTDVVLQVRNFYVFFFWLAVCAGI